VDIYLRLDEGEQELLLSMEVNDEKKFNSWFTVYFEEAVHVPKSAICTVQVTSLSGYTFIPPDFILKKCETLESRGLFSNNGAFLFEREETETGDEYVPKYFNLGQGRNCFNIKSFSVSLPQEEDELESDDLYP